ncbi:hypothetical protein ACQU0X_14715 [Pseudovibrio ascidiaceicola]|uniref:hypothetical protein n=1 Tax=Pseudovibrio TaxID=258255 RepID=UPI0007AED43D|nr:hypothetical protein [Pseudovibrio sp. WM33]KZL17519.1 hypothetical protein PsWM33_05258 [Pseudovibrio sp. WM33]
MSKSFEFRSFADLLQSLEDGELQRDATIKMEEVASAITAHVEQHGGNPEASINLKIKFKAKKGIVEVTPQLTSTVPQPPRAGSILWPTGNGFSPQNPQQMHMFDGPREIETSETDARTI